MERNILSNSFVLFPVLHRKQRPILYCHSKSQPTNRGPLCSNSPARLVQTRLLAFGITRLRSRYENLVNLIPVTNCFSCGNGLQFCFISEVKLSTDYINKPTFGQHLSTPSSTFQHQCQHLLNALVYCMESYVISKFTDFTLLYLLTYLLTYLQNMKDIYL